jgi:uncharacterized protein
MGQAASVLPDKKIQAFCQKHHIRKLSLYGSVLRGEAKTDSDIDILVEFHADHTPGLIRLAGIELKLSELLGRKVDLRTPEDLSRYFREEVINTAEAKYAEG